MAIISNGTTIIDNGAFSLATGGVVAVEQSITGDTYLITTTSAQGGGSTGTEISGLTVTMTPSSSSNKFLICLSAHLQGKSDYMQYANLTYQISGSTEKAVTSGNTRGVTTRFDASNVLTDMEGAIAVNVLIEPATTNAITFRLRCAVANSATRICINRTQNNNTDASDGGYPISSLTVFELAGSVTTRNATGMNFAKT